jgi:hAT family C-terminal dimerisation region
MASSVSSERAFSQGGITITKRRNRLGSDIVEALQCVKCCIRHCLLFREPAPSSALEKELDSENDEREEREVVEEKAWDSTLLGGDEDDERGDDESDF